MVTPITVKLAQQLELAEAEWNTAKLEALSGTDNNARNVQFKQFGNIQAMAIGSHAYNPSYNRAFNLTADDADKIADVSQWFKEQNVSVWMDVVPPLIDSSVLKALNATAYFPAFFLNTVFADLNAVPVQDAIPAQIDEVKTPSQYDEYALVLSSAFGIPMDLVRDTASFVQQEHALPNWRLLLAKVDGQPAALASLFLGEHTASIPSMGTAAEYRRRGLQRMMLEACKTYAKTAGYSLIATQVEPASASERNTLRAGFEIAYTKGLWGDKLLEF